MGHLSNAEIAELLARAAESEEGIWQRAYKKAARSAFLWPAQARELFEEGRSLIELKGVGPFIAQRLRSWLEDPPEKAEPPPLRRDFLALADARALLVAQPNWSKQLRATCKCTRIGAMARAASRRWRRRRMNAVTNTLRLPITRRD